ncbi:MAG: preprotein translocase subunit YajC [Propionibacteriaceae bacterium]|nr:preprotein translocase subunit YajC [Propionibacteriaceae bacterium]
MDLILMIVAFGALMYFLMIRPQQKRVKEHQASIGALTTGTRVLLTSGVFATVRHLGERHAIVELAPGVEITIIKGNIARPTTADEEEFEFADDVDVVSDVDGLVLEGDEASADLVDPDMTIDPEMRFDHETTFDPRGDDISPEELQRRFDEN